MYEPLQQTSTDIQPVQGVSVVGAATATSPSMNSAPHVSRVDDSGLASQVAALPEPIRLHMQLIARTASSSDAALAPIIELLVDGSPQKRAAIVTAFRSHDALRAQWERTYEILRA